VFWSRTLSSQYPCPSSSILAASVGATHRQSVVEAMPAPAAQNDAFFDDSVQVLPSFLNDVIVTENNSHGSKVYLPEKFSRQCTEEFEIAFDAFDHISLNDNETDPTGEVRTDVTKQLLSTAAAAWPDLDDDEST
jgi:hypothetical protein